MYSSKPVPVLYPDQAQFIDGHCSQSFSIPLDLLMENAGRGVADVLVEDQAEVVLFVLGVGNNGADGLVAARHLLERGIHPVLYIYGDRDKASDLFKKQWAIVETLGIDQVESLDGLDWTQYSHVVEGLIGTGLKGDLREPMRDILYTMNAFARAHACALWAIDLPAGLNALSGQVDEATPIYTGTITFGASKVGQWLYPGRTHCGQVEVLPLGLPWEGIPGLYEDAPRAYLLDREFIAGLLQERSPLAHKGVNGHVAVLGGSKDMPGAPALAANAAVYSGAGKTTVITAQVALAGLRNSIIPEVMTASYQDDAAYDAIGERLSDLLADKDAVAIGPGLGRTQEASRMVQNAIKGAKSSLVVDADAFYAQDLEELINGGYLAGAVCTPHIGELAHITGLSNKRVLDTYMDLGLDLAKRSGATWVIKGIPSVVATPDGEIFINPIGNPGMGSGGMGDTLSGIIAAYIAQGYPSKLAALIGVYLHSAAADNLAKDKVWGYTASDVAKEVGHVVTDLLADQD